MVFQQFGEANAIGFYASETFVSAGFSSGYLGNLLLGSIQVSAPGTFIGCLLAGIFFYLKAFSGSFSTRMGGVPWVMMSKIFPINIKGNAGSLVTLVRWSGSWLTTYAFNFLMSWSPAGTFFLYSAASAMTVLFVTSVVPETKGRALVEVQASMNS